MERQICRLGSNSCSSSTPDDYDSDTTQHYHLQLLLLLCKVNCIICVQVHACRFDDTNPAKEDEEFEKSILEDAKLLKIKWAKVTHTSDYFEQLQDACQDMITKGTTIHKCIHPSTALYLPYEHS